MTIRPAYRGHIVNLTDMTNQVGFRPATLTGALHEHTACMCPSNRKDSIMLFKSAATFLAAALLTGPALAQTVSQGDAQLAAIAGVPAGSLSTADLINLINAQRDGDEQTVNFILDKAGIGVARADDGATAPASGQGWDMLARLNGVEPGEYTPEELVKMDYDRLN
jgi:hypothetical protein